MSQNKKSRKIIIIGGGAFALVILGITLSSFQPSKAQQSCVSGYFYSNINGGCVYDQYNQAAQGGTPSDFSIFGGTDAANRAHWNFTAAKVGALSEDGTKRYVTTKCGNDTANYCNVGATDCSGTPGASAYVVTNALGGANERCVIGASASDVVCLQIVLGQPTTELTTGSCRSGTPAPPYTHAVRCSNANYVIKRDSEGYDKCVPSTSVADYKLCSFPKADNSGSTQIYASECPSSETPSRSDIICLMFNGSQPTTEVTTDKCKSNTPNTTVAIRCSNSDLVISRDGQSYDQCVSLSSVANYKLCSIPKLDNSGSTKIYASECPSSGVTPPPPPPPSGSLCPRKPDPAKGTVEPAAIPDGYEIKAVPSYYLWGCYSQPDKSENASCTAQATKRTGNISSPCLYGEESIACPTKGTAYRDGNFLKCAPLKKKGGSTAEIPPTVITQTIRETVTVEVPAAAPPVDCRDYKKEILEKTIPQGNALLEVADSAFEGTNVKNPEFKKIFYQILRDSAKSSRKLEKLSTSNVCEDQTVNQLNDAVREYEGDNLTRVRQSLVFLDKETKVQNQYLGIQNDFKWFENFKKTLKEESEQKKAFADEVKAYAELKAEFEILVEADKEGKVFAFEVDDIVQRIALLRKDIESKVQSQSLLKEQSKSLKKIVKPGTKKLKKSAKASKKVKKTSKKAKGKKKAKPKSEKQ